MKFIPSEYKQRNMKIWNEVAPRYHKRWASVNKGPFQSTKKLVESVNINKGDAVLDVACGTGVVTNEIQKKIGKSGYVVGVDTSTTAIKIAKKWNGKKDNVNFVNTDAEKFSFSKKFDIITCQYALFFFPNAQKALKNMKNSLKNLCVIFFVFWATCSLAKSIDSTHQVFVQLMLQSIKHVNQEMNKKRQVFPGVF